MNKNTKCDIDAHRLPHHRRELLSLVFSRNTNCFTKSSLEQLVRVPVLSGKMCDERSKMK